MPHHRNRRALLATIALVATGVTLAGAAPSARASYTCVSGTTCSESMTASGAAAFTFSLAGTGFTLVVTCTMSASADVADGTSSFGLKTLVLSPCTNNSGCSGFFITGSLLNWSFALASSTPTSPGSYGLNVTTGFTFNVSGCALGTSGSLAVTPQACSTAAITTTNSTIELACSNMSYTATGIAAIYFGMSGTTGALTATLTYSKALTVS